MSGEYIDLHTHSTASDGTDAPARVLELAAALGHTADEEVIHRDNLTLL